MRMRFSDKKCEFLYVLLIQKKCIWFFRKKIQFRAKEFRFFANYLTNVNTKLLTTKLIFLYLRSVRRCVFCRSRGELSRGQANIWLKTNETTRLGAPEAVPPRYWEKDNTKMKSRKEEERKAQIVYPNPGDRQVRSEPGYVGYSNEYLILSSI